MAHLFQRGELPLNIILSLIHNAPSLEKWMSSIAAQGWITLDRKQHIKRYVDTFGKGLSDIISQSKMAVFVLIDWHLTAANQSQSN